MGGVGTARQSEVLVMQGHGQRPAGCMQSGFKAPWLGSEAEIVDDHDKRAPRRHASVGRSRWQEGLRARHLRCFLHKGLPFCKAPRRVGTGRDFSSECLAEPELSVVLAAYIRAARQQCAAPAAGSLRKPSMHSMRVACKAHQLTALTTHFRPGLQSTVAQLETQLACWSPSCGERAAVCFMSTPRASCGRRVAPPLHAGRA